MPIKPFTSTKRFHHISQPFPAFFPDMSFVMQHVQADLEKAHLDERQTRVLVPIEASQNPTIFLTCVERLLRVTKDARLLLLTSASAHQTVFTLWQTASSNADGHQLAASFPIGSLLPVPPGPPARVCLSTIRELHLQQIEKAQSLSKQFAIVLLSDLPAGQLSPVWKRVIEALQAPYVIAFCAHPTQTVIAWFEGTLIREESDEDATQ